MRRSGGRQEATLEIPSGYERVDVTCDLGVGDRVQVSRRRTWTTVTFVDNWYVTTQDSPTSPKKMYTCASVVAACRPARKT